MSELLTEFCDLPDYMINLKSLDQFDDLTVEPMGHIHDNKHEDDAGMIEATFQHMKYHYNRGKK